MAESSRAQKKDWLALFSPAEAEVLPEGVKTVPLAHAGCSWRGFRLRDLKQLRDAGIRLSLGQTDQAGLLYANAVRLVKRPEREEASKKAYLAMCGKGRRELLISRATREADTARILMEEARRMFLTRATAYQEAIAKHEGVLRIPESFEQAEAEFSLLDSNPDVRGVRVTADRFEVFTDWIDIEHTDKDTTETAVHRIGRFRIEISPNDGRVLFFNQTHPLGPPMKRHRCAEENFKYKQHPHVFSNHKACMGNLEVMVPQIIAERKYAAAALVCIQFLKSYEPGHVGILDEWPKKETP